MQTHRDQATSPPSAELNAFRNAVAEATWITSKTYPSWMRHAYTLRKDHPDLFPIIQKAVRNYGYDETFFGKMYHYLIVDGYKYWAFQALVNREPLEMEDQHRAHGS
jgi:hypothetical protein